VKKGTRRILITLLVVLVVPELCVRAWLRTHASRDQVLQYASLAQLEARYEPELFTLDRHLGFAPTPNFEDGPNRHNAYGLRGAELEVPKPEGEFRIACIGASMSYTSQVKDWTRSYPDVMESELEQLGHSSVRTLNAGCNNWTSIESLISYQLRLRPLEPDLLIVYHGPNDLKARFVWPPEKFRADYGGSARPPVDLMMVPLWQHSSLLRAFAVRMGYIRSHADLSNTLAPLSPDSHWERFNRQLRLGTFPSHPFGKIPVERILRMNTTEHYESNLRALVACAALDGARVVLATFQPVDAGVYVKSEKGRRLLERGYREMNEALARVAADTTAVLYDFAAQMPNDPQYFADDVHVNVEGARIKGELFARFLDGSGLLP